MALVAAAGQQLLVSSTSAVKVSVNCRFPLLRRIDADTAILVDTRIARSGFINAWVLRKSGEMLSRFSVGDGVEDVLPLTNRIVVTYFDEGVYGMDGPNQEGLAVFSVDGAFQWGYHTRFRDTGSIDDCYAACCASENEVAFIPYSNFRLVILNVVDCVQVEYPIPDEVAGVGALTLSGSVAYGSGSYHHRTSIFRWQLGSSCTERVTFHSGTLRGLSQGRFIAVGTSGYTIIGPEGDEESAESEGD
jgi:hypothetical protein